MRSKDMLEIRKVVMELLNPLAQRIANLEKYVRLHCDHQETLEYTWSGFYEEYQERCTVCGKVTRTFSNLNEFEIAKLEYKRERVESKLAALREVRDDR